MSNSPNFDLFLSYNSLDKKNAKKLDQDLSSRGLAVWFDQRQVPPGGQIVEHLQSGIKSCRSAIILVGRHGFGKWQGLEINALVQMFIDNALPVIPVLWPRAAKPALPLFLRGFSWVDLGEGYDAGLTLIAGDVERRKRPRTFLDVAPPLHMAEHDFIQILLTKVDLLRRNDHPTGVRLQVTFDYNTPTITTREARRFLRQNMPNFANKSKSYQAKLDKFLLRGQGFACCIDDPDFVFRYGNGGTLPVLRVRGEEFYCLFLRTRHPIGWNIANGGADSLEELLHPEETIYREYREELIMVRPREWLTPSLDIEPGLDRPQFAAARVFWNKRFDEIGRPRFEHLVPVSLATSAALAPDVMAVTFRSELPVNREVKDVFVNITTEDFGIEVDRILSVCLADDMRFADDDLLLLDGEINAGRSVNRPIGLFRVEGFDCGQKRITPAMWCHNAKWYKGGVLPKEVATAVLRQMTESVSQEVVGEFERELRVGRGAFRVCPITDRIIRRH